MADPDQVLSSMDKRTNFQRLANLLISVGTGLLREIFDKYCLPSALPRKLNDPSTKEQLKHLKLSKLQWDILYPSTGVYSKSADFDITLLSSLLLTKTICDLPPPRSGWDKPLASGDQSLAADLMRVRASRNELYAHGKYTMDISDDDFQSKCKEIREVLIRIAGHLSSVKKKSWHEAIDKSLTSPLRAEDKRNVENRIEQLRQIMLAKCLADTTAESGLTEAPCLGIHMQAFPGSGPQAGATGHAVRQRESQDMAGDSLTTNHGEDFFLLLARRYVEAVNLSTTEEFAGLLHYLLRIRKVIVADIQIESLTILVKCSSLSILHELWEDYRSGHLGEMVQKCLVTDETLSAFGVTGIEIETSICEEDYRACEQDFFKLQVWRKQDVTSSTVSLEGKDTETMREDVECEIPAHGTPRPRGIQGEMFSYEKGSVLDPGENRELEFKSLVNAPPCSLPWKIMEKAKTFICACLNGCREGIIYFGVGGNQEKVAKYHHGEIIGLDVEHIRDDVNKAFQCVLDDHIRSDAGPLQKGGEQNCINIHFVPVKSQGTRSSAYVIEIEVARDWRFCEDRVYYSKIWTEKRGVDRKCGGKKALSDFFKVKNEWDDVAVRTYGLSTFVKPLEVAHHVKKPLKAMYELWKSGKDPGIQDVTSLRPLSEGDDTQDKDVKGEISAGAAAPDSQSTASSDGAKKRKGDLSTEEPASKISKTTSSSNPSDADHAEDATLGSSNDETKSRKTDSNPPEVDVAVLTNKELPKTSKRLDLEQLPIDILLLTVKDCEFLACLSLLTGFSRMFRKELGDVYIGNIGEMKIAVMKCRMGAAGPGSAAGVVRDAVKALTPKAVFCVGYCGGLQPVKVKLGDVVISEVLITYAPSKVTKDGIEERGDRVPLKPNLSKVTLNAAAGWSAPLRDPAELEVAQVRGALLSGPQVVDDSDLREALLNRFPGAIAIEMEDEGVYSAAHDLDVEWVIIKGVSDFADGKNSEKNAWRPFASIMAASLVAHILSNPIIFEDWPHYNNGKTSLPPSSVSVQDTSGRVESLEDVLRKHSEELLKLTNSGTHILLDQPSLPPNACDFIGREREIKEIASHLRSPLIRVVSIYGPPGSGKSEVAIAVGHNLKSEGKAIYHIDLTDVNTEDDLISAILRFFSDQSLGPLKRLDFLLKQFSLIKDSVAPYFILDNADSLLQTRKSRDRFLKTIKQILTSCASVKILVATRESSEYRKLKPLGQKLVRIGSVDNVFSHKLVQNCFPEGCDRDWRKVSLFCGHMPFAIRLFCNNMPRNELPLSQAIDNFVSLIESDLSELDDQDEPEEEKLNAILESSYQILSAENKEFYVSLSVIPGLFHEKVAAAVWGISTHDAQRTLQSLQRKSLIDSCVVSKPYKVHNIFRLFARQKGAREMNEVIVRSTTRFIQFYISLFAELNDSFLSGQSMSAFIDFYEDKQNIMSSLINGCLNISTRDSCFDGLTQGMLFMDAVLWSDRASFNKIYDTAITEAKQSTDSTAYNELVLAKTFSEVTWGTEEVETKQLQCSKKEVLSCDSDEQKGKLLCYLGIHKLANGQIMDGVTHLENSLVHFKNIADPMQKILRILTLQILEQYYESIQCVEKAATFFENAKEECGTRGQQGLFLIPNIPGKNVKIKEDEWRMLNEENRPLELEIYFLLTKATKIFSSTKTVELFDREVNKMKKQMEEKCNSVENLKVGSLYIHRFFVGVLAEMTRYEEAIESIQAAICHQENVISMAEDIKETRKEALARSYSYLAVLQFRVQDYNSSLRSQRRAMDIKREIFDEQHPDVADSYHEFAIISRTIGDCDSALQFQKRVLEIRLNFAEQNPLNVAASYHELGVTQCKMKDYSSALRSHESALAIRLKNLGRNHRDTANSYHELGITQWYLEIYQCALDSHQNALRILLHVMGDHPRATADSYHEIGKTSFCLEDNRAALQSHLRAFRLRLEVLGEQHTDTANSCCEIGVTQFEMGWYASALQYHTRALNMRQTMHGNSPHPEVAQSFYQLARVQCQMENFDEAVNSLSRALSIRKGLNQEQDLEAAEVYHEIGKAFIHKEDFTSAIEMHQLALGIRESQMGEEHALVADSLFQLGLVEWKQERHEESLQLHRRAADIREKYFGKKHHRTAESYFQLGLMLSELKRHSEALTLHQQALEIRQKLQGCMETSIADSSLETGCALINVGQFGSAFSSLENALTIRTQIVAKEDGEVADLPHEKKVKELLLQDYQSSLQLYKRVSTIIHDHSSSVRSQNNSLKELLVRFEGQLTKKATCYFDVGEEEFSRGKLDAALHAHQRALNLRVTLLGDNHRDTASSFLSKGKVHFKMMDYTKALKSHQRALDIRREILGDNHPHTAHSYDNIGITQDILGHYTLALQSHKRALEIKRNTTGENHLDTAGSYRNIGCTHLHLGNYDSAFQSHLQALKISRDKLGDNHPHTALCYQSIGDTQFHLRDYTSALQLQRLALEINLGTHGKKHPETASSYHAIGKTHRQLGNYTLSLRLLKRALKIYGAVHEENHLDTASTYVSIGILWQDLGDYTSSLQSYQQAIEIFRQRLGENHPDTAITYNNIGYTQKEMGDYTSALQSLQQAYEISLERLGENHPTTAMSKRNLLKTTTKIAQGHSTVLNSHQPVLRKRHRKRLMHDNPDAAISNNVSGLTEESLGRRALLRLSLQGTQVREEISGKKHSESSNTSDKFWLIKCALVILLILMILSFGILPGFSSSEKRFI